MKEEKPEEKEIKEIKEEIGEEERFTPVVVHQGGQCKHYWEFSNHEASGSDAYSCKYCPCGILIDPKTTKIVNGKICKKLSKK